VRRDWMEVLQGRCCRRDEEIEMRRWRERVVIGKFAGPEASSVLIDAALISDLKAIRSLKFVEMFKPGQHHLLACFFNFSR
jgi:hypothetical protein